MTIGIKTNEDAVAHIKRCAKKKSDLFNEPINEDQLMEIWLTECSVAIESTEQKLIDSLNSLVYRKLSHQAHEGIVEKIEILLDFDNDDNYLFFTYLTKPQIERIKKQFADLGWTSDYRINYFYNEMHFTKFILRESHDSFKARQHELVRIRAEHS